LSQRLTVSSLARTISAIYLGNQTPLGSQQDHLCARPQPCVAGGAVQLFQSVELLGGKGVNTDGFHGLLLRPQAYTPRNLSVCT
jgi:hypothetical protein